MRRAFGAAARVGDGDVGDEPGVEDTLRELVAVENECCSWAAWAVETNGEATVLDVRSTGPGIATLHGMFRPPQTAR